MRLVGHANSRQLCELCLVLIQQHRQLEQPLRSNNASYVVISPRLYGCQPRSSYSIVLCTYKIKMHSMGRAVAAVNNLHDLTSGYEDSVMDHCTEVCSVGMQFYV